MMRRAAVRRAAFAALATSVIYACTRAPSATPNPRFVLGAPYQSGGVWFYPRDTDNLDETGLAVILKPGHAPLTTNGEVFDQTALAAAHATLQLPAIASLTNLENGLRVTVRVNDRGAPDPGRLVQVTSRTAALLGMSPDSVTRVRLQVLPVESRAAAASVPGAPTLAISAAPRGVVEVAELPPPPGVRQGGAGAPSVSAAKRPVEAAPAPSPLRLPEVVVRTPPRPGRLMVRLDTFDQFVYASTQQAKTRRADAQIVTIKQGRNHQFRVEIGPVKDVPGADAALLQALRSGIPDARIVVD